MSNAPKKKKRGDFAPRLIRGLYIVLFVLSLLVVVGYAALNIFAPAPTVDSQVTFNPTGPDVSAPVGSQEPGTSAEPIPTPTPLVLNRREGVYTCLLLGVADLGGSDTIMLGVFDTQARTASLISIPRDTVVNYNGRYMKVNAVYSVGGAEAVAGVVKDTLCVPVDYWVSVNIRAFETIVNQIGGVYFTVPVDMNYDDPAADLSIHIKAGYQLLNGEDAVGVMRCRNCYPNADVGRAATQRAFLVALVKQTITPSNVTKVTSLINTLSRYVRSDMPVNDMVYFATQAIGMDLNASLTTGSLAGDWISPYWYLNSDAALELVNGLGIYEEQIPAEVMQIIQP